MRNPARVHVGSRGARHEDRTRLLKTVYGRVEVKFAVDIITNRLLRREVDDVRGSTVFLCVAPPAEYADPNTLSA